MGKAIRDVYGETLAAIKDKRVVVLDADVSASTKSALYAKEHPERFYNVGIAEANMTAMAAGFASVGMIPFVNTFGCFLASNGLLSIRSFASYSKLPIKLVGAYGGMSDSFDGPSHHTLDDIAIMRALPNLEVYVPSDPEMVRWLIPYAVQHEKPMYLRMSRDVFPEIYEEREQFIPGKGKIVRKGTDCTVIACGLLVGNALKAAKKLEGEGISLRVVDMYCIKPLDRELIIQCAEETGAIVSAEEHTVFGGLGSAVAETLCGNDCHVPLEILGVNDVHGECGPYADLQKKYGLDAEAICNKVRKAIARKR